MLILPDRQLRLACAPALNRPRQLQYFGTGPDGKARQLWTDVLKVTDLGRAMLKGTVDFMSLRPPNRWVGGVQIGPGMPAWRWNDAVYLSG